MTEQRNTERNVITPAPASAVRKLSRSSLALDNLRGVVIVVVLAFHSALAYVSWAPADSGAFDQPPYVWRAFPILDRHRFFGFDLFCAWQDVYLMSLMFFLSGLFVWPSIARKGRWGFLRDRALRLGVPYLFGIFVVMSLASYPSYAMATTHPTITGYWRALTALPFWPIGPLWFLCELLALSAMAVLVELIAPATLKKLAAGAIAAEARPGRAAVCFLLGSALLYVPLSVAFTPWAWGDWAIFGIQLCRPLHYALYFFTGIAAGARGIDHGFLATDGPLAQRWPVCLMAAVGSLLAWMGLTSLTLNDDASLPAQLAAGLGFVLACACGCVFFIAGNLRFAAAPSRALGGLGANAYALYLLHYVFVVWLQFALLSAPLFAPVKWAIVFAGTLTASVVSAVGLQRLPVGARLIGSVRRPAADRASATRQERSRQSRADAARSTQ